MGREPAPGQVMIYPGDAMIDLSKPLLTPWELAPKFFVRRRRAHRDGL